VPVSAQPRFVVVLGAARSGTTLLRDLISAHPAVAAVPFDVNHVWRIGNEQQPDDVLVPESATPEVAERIRSRLTAFARRNAGAADWSNVRFIAEKTVGNALRPAFVEKVLPGTLYVRIVRDPRRTIASTIAAWKAPPDAGYLVRKARYFGLADLGYAAWYAANAVRGRLSHGRGLKVWGARYAGIREDLEALGLETVCARQWLASVRSIDAFFQDLPADRGVSVSYEDLTADPAALARIWSFLGIADEARAAEVFRDTVVSNASGCPELPGSINGETLRAVEDLVARYGYA